LDYFGGIEIVWNKIQENKNSKTTSKFHWVPGGWIVTSKICKHKAKHSLFVQDAFHVCEITDWEELQEPKKAHAQSYRMKVHGGWIVRTCVTRKNKADVRHVFITDIFHQWEAKRWEETPDLSNRQTKAFRLTVPEGWIVRSHIHGDKWGMNIALSLIVDTEHEWTYDAIFHENL